MTQSYASRKAKQSLSRSPFPEMLGAGLTEAAVWNGKVLETMASAGRAYLDFVGRRFEQDMIFLQRLAVCRSPSEVQATYLAFWQRAADDYQREFAAMQRFGTTVAAEAMRAPEQQSRSETTSSERTLSEAA